MIDQLRPTGLRVPAEAPPPLQSFSTTTRERLTSELAVFTSALRFNHILRVASERGRAHFRDMSVSYSFEAVWRHRLSMCVHTQAASQMLTLVSAGADEAEAEEEAGGPVMCTCFALSSHDAL